MINVTIKNLSIGIIVLAMLYYSDSGHCSTDLVKYGVWILSAIILTGYSIHYLYTSIRDRIIKENKAIIEQSKMIQEFSQDIRGNADKSLKLSRILVEQFYAKSQKLISI